MVAAFITPSLAMTFEQAYCDVIIQALEDGIENLQVGTLVISPAQRTMLVNQLPPAQRALVNQLLPALEQQVCENLLSYLQKVKSIRDQKFAFMEEAAILKHEWAKLDLHFTSANKINASLLSHYVKPLSESDKLDKLRWRAVRQGLRAAIAQEGSRSPQVTENALKNLELTLDTPESEIPAPEEVQCDCKINYIPLWRLLKNREWKRANQETYLCLLVASIRPERNTQEIDVNRLSCQDLQTIDFLWRKYSKTRFGKEHFGFSVQFRIWKRAKFNLEQLAKELYWQHNNSWIDEDTANFSCDAIEGHLPLLPHIGWWCWVGGMAALLNKVDECQRSDRTS